MNISWGVCGYLLSKSSGGFAVRLAPPGRSPLCLCLVLINALTARVVYEHNAQSSRAMVTSSNLVGGFCVQVALASTPICSVRYKMLLYHVSTLIKFCNVPRLTTCRMFVPCAHQRLNSKLAIMSTTHKTRRAGEVPDGTYSIHR